ncbi:reverse transcriptase (RNA-dependent DNA polymerase) domain-containing protein [Phthorimaea operculella]|nr:reverse transcriptase (RNA-dependent DNA polymerase) domain-containing protein [Phthorimaea operculella]
MSDILQQVTGKSSSFVRDSTHFTQLLEKLRLEEDDAMVSFDVASLFTNVPVEDTISIIANLVEQAGIPTEYMSSIELCLRSGYLMWRGEYYLQVDGVAMGSPIAPVAANIFMEWFEQEAMRDAPCLPKCWLRCVDDVFAIVKKDKVETLMEHLNSVHSKIKFTVENEAGGTLPFLDVLVMRMNDGSLRHTVYRKPTHTDRYLKADSHHHPQHLSSVPRSLINRALRLCHPDYIDSELDHVREVLSSNGYEWKQSLRIANSSNKQKPHTVERRPIYLPFVKG